MDFESFTYGILFAIGLQGFTKALELLVMHGLPKPALKKLSLVCCFANLITFVALVVTLLGRLPTSPLFAVITIFELFSSITNLTLFTLVLSRLQVLHAEFNTEFYVILAIVGLGTTLEIIKIVMASVYYVAIAINSPYAYSSALNIILSMTAVVQLTVFLVTAIHFFLKASILVDKSTTLVCMKELTRHYDLKAYILLSLSIIFSLITFKSLQSFLPIFKVLGTTAALEIYINTTFFTAPRILEEFRSYGASEKESRTRLPVIEHSNTFNVKRKGVILSSA